MSLDAKTEQLLVMLGSALETANAAYSMLVDHMSEDNPPAVVNPTRSSDPDLCMHPLQMTLDVDPPHLMCKDCGMDLGPQYINGG